jgi:hypothetical protein
MMTALTRLLGGIASLRLTLFCLAAAFVLVFAGTLAQVRLGLFFVQEQYFQSWLIWWSAPAGGFKIPVFPGGHLIGAVLLVNLLASLISRFAWSWRKLGIQFIHLGLIIMLAGGLATDLFSVSSYMRLKEGETKNYSEDSGRMELAVSDLTDSKNVRVIAVPGAVLGDGGTISHESLPFRIVVRSFYRNSELRMIGPEAGSAVPASTQGAGARISITSIPRATKMDARDVMSAVVEIVPAKGGAALGTWLVSDAMAAAQEFDLDGRQWSLELRAARYYKPYSLKLEDFTHETYPGTQIPKNFSSKVILNDDVKNDHRQVVIYMNHPLRYLGDTYYQSGFEPDNSGTVLQVVRNPSYQAPYIACVIVSLGLILQFSFHLTGFARRAKPAAAP